MAKFRPRKVDEVDAERFVGSHADAMYIIGWLEHLGFDASYEVHLDRIVIQINPDADNVVIVYPNHWIVVDKDGNLKELTNAQFRDEYEDAQTPKNITVTGGSNMQFGDGNNQVNHF